MKPMSSAGTSERRGRSRDPRNGVAGRERVGAGPRIHATKLTAPPVCDRARVPAYAHRKGERQQANVARLLERGSHLLQVLDDVPDVTRLESGWLLSCIECAVPI